MLVKAGRLHAFSILGFAFFVKLKQTSEPLRPDVIYLCTAFAVTEFCRTLLSTTNTKRQKMIFLNHMQPTQLQQADQQSLCLRATQRCSM